MILIFFASETPKKNAPPKIELQGVHLSLKIRFIDALYFPNTPNPVRRIMKRRTGATNFIIIT